MSVSTYSWVKYVSAQLTSLKEWHLQFILHLTIQLIRKVRCNVNLFARAEPLEKAIQQIIQYHDHAKQLARHHPARMIPVCATKSTNCQIQFSKTFWAHRKRTYLPRRCTSVSGLVVMILSYTISVRRATSCQLYLHLANQKEKLKTLKRFGNFTNRANWQTNLKHEMESNNQPVCFSHWNQKFNVHAANSAVKFERIDFAHLWETTKINFRTKQIQRNCKYKMALILKTKQKRSYKT